MIFKLIKKILKILIFLLIIWIIYFYVRNHFINKKNTKLLNYTPQSEYQQKYDVNKYVSESLNSSNLYSNIIISNMFNYSDYLESESLLLQFQTFFKSIFNIEYKYSKEINSLQYVENELLTLEEVNEDDHNYEFIAVDALGKEVIGNVAIYGKKENVKLVISFFDDNKNIDMKKARVLSDDSNAEMLAYLIVEQTQKIYETDMDPNEASKYFYGSNIEKLAGDISYHAIVAYIISSYELNNLEEVEQKVEQINIDKTDNNNFLMSRRY